MCATRRASLLQDDPDTGPVDMPTLVGIAAAIENEAARRYAALADLMAGRGAVATAAAFRAMHQEELHHVEAVDRWAASVGQPADAPGDYAWHLPPELGTSWDEIANSALLTPFRAFAVAVCNEQRAFEFYSYLAARATDDRVRTEAEKLAAEELAHAATLRRWRRLAWHRERREAGAGTPAPVTDVAGLERFLEHSRTGILACHRAVAARLREIGDPDSAGFIEELAAGGALGGATGAAGAAGMAVAAPGDTLPDAERAAIVAATASVPLMVIAQRPLELLAERLEAILDASQGELFEATVVAIEAAVAALARIALRVPSS